MKKILFALALVSAAAFANPVARLTSILNNDGKTMQSIAISSGFGFPEVFVDPEFLSLENGVMTFIQKKNVKGSKNEIARQFKNVPVMIVITENAKDLKKSMVVTTAAETSDPLPCSKKLEGVARAQLAVCNNLVTVLLGGSSVFVKTTFKMDITDGLIKVEGIAANNNKTTIYAYASITSVALAMDGEKKLNNVTIAGTLNVPLIPKKGIL
jgi:hypothetical protein